MQVESFECTETIEEQYEQNEEANTLIEQLGLEGQKTLLCPSNDENPVRCPYPEATKEQRWVFEQICPNKIKLKDYKRTTIPLRVLQIAAHANSLDIFKEIVVWDKEDSQLKDPVLIGLGGDSTWNPTIYLLARWGDELESWNTLLNKAAEIWRAKAICKSKELLNKLNGKISELKAMSNDDVIHGDRELPNLYY
jgi:hypothetical protein